MRVILAATLIGALAPAAALDSLTLKEEVAVKGPKVTLGDVAVIEGDNAASLAAIDLGLAAAPGGSKRLDAAVIVARLKAAGVPAESVEVNGARGVSVTTLHQEITRDTVAEQLRLYIEHEMPWDPVTTEMDFALTFQDAVVPDGDVVFEWRTDPGCRFLGSGGFRGAIRVDGKVVKSFVCKAQIEAYADLVVADEDIPRGKTLSLGDLKTESRPLSALKDPAFKNPADLAGYVAKANIAAGQVITKHSVAPQVVVKRNQLVSVETRAGGLEIMTQARAASDAAIGDIVTCINTSSKQGFQGVVRGDGVVVVE